MAVRVSQHPAMQYILICFALLSGLSVSAQQQGTWIPEAASRASWDAHLLMEEGRHAEAAPLFKKSIAAWNGRDTADTWHEAARAFGLTGDTTAATQALEQLCKLKRFFEHESILADSAFTALRTNARFLAAVNCIKANQQTLAPQYNAAWRKTLLDMQRADQAIRNAVEKARSANANPAETERLLVRLDSIDDANSRALDTFLSQHGWPGPDVIDYAGCSAIILLLTHANVDVKTKHLHLAKAAAASNAIHPAQFATLQDKLSVFQNGYQVYGTQIYFQNGTATIFPIQDEANVNQRRKAFGMDSIESYLSHFGIKYQYDPAKPKTDKEIPRISHK